MWTMSFGGCVAIIERVCEERKKRERREKETQTEIAKQAKECSSVCFAIFCAWHLMDFQNTLCRSVFLEWYGSFGYTSNQK